ncbi:MAG: 16S rRNA (cytosine(1402)-N(4))-methyltransferase RsmH [Micrococcales bacterium]
MNLSEKSASELHVPVMLERTLEILGESLNGADAILVDCTLGLGGHTEAFLERFPELTVVGIDRDLNALDLAGKRLARFGNRFKFAHATYDQILEVLDELGIAEVQGVLLDLGVSSMQLDEAGRGFAYSYDAPLDMRMDDSEEQTAAAVLNEYSEGELVRIFKEYGEERYAKQIASAVVRERAIEPFETSQRLAKLIVDIVPFIPGKSKGHPAKRVFQALRIEVNRELDVLKDTMPAVIQALAIGGRVLVLAYHSLEDRIVKQALATAATSSAPLDLPIELPEHAPILRLVVKGAEQATETEIQLNPRATSVRLRAAEKIRRAA